jgi:hypothetical protein
MDLGSPRDAILPHRGKGDLRAGTARRVRGRRPPPIARSRRRLPQPHPVAVRRDGLIRRERALPDARRQVVGLTDHGRDVYRDLDARSGEQIGRILSALPDDAQRRLVGAMDTISWSRPGASSCRDGTGPRRRMVRRGPVGPFGARIPGVRERVPLTCAAGSEREVPGRRRSSGVPPARPVRPRCRGGVRRRRREDMQGRAEHGSAVGSGWGDHPPAWCRHLGPPRIAGDGRGRIGPGPHDMLLRSPHCEYPSMTMT